ncbi:ribosomal protein L7/L12 [Nocardioides sp. Root190]|uniref:ribosomal protein L7/L12 n=1 Tax=Nocardioides sp. Root190 TaxID=1736488 RepID=UPI000A445CFC|nr:ribosomal protein L7/L12 [Nocardioides sp. Root190]
MVAVRAAPRLLLLMVFAVGALTSELDWLRVVAAMLFVLNAGRLLSPTWRHYVATGEQLTAVIDQKYCQSGDQAVELLEAGPREIEVIRALREVRALSLLEAKKMLDVPALIASGVSAGSAAAMVDRLSSAGARASITSRGD